MTNNEKAPGIEPWPRPPELTITWYDSPEEVHRSLWSEAAAEYGVPVDELLQGTEVGALDENGQEVSVTQEQVLEGMRAMGCWGWVDTEQNVIHAWMAPDADPELVAHFLAHEIGHVTGHPDPDDFQEEMRAEQFGYVASQALRLLREAGRYHFAGLQAKVQELLEERNRTGLAIDKAITAGEVPEQHPLLSRLQMLANHHQQLAEATRQIGAMATLVNRMFIMMNMAGDVPEKGSLNPVKAWLFDAQTALAGKLPEPSNAACQLPASQDHMADLLRETLGPLRTGLGFVRNFHIIDRIEKALGPSAVSCWCQACRPVTVEDMRFVVCPDCGNKRCPRANDHRHACTGSNEPGQSGSAYAPKNAPSL